MNSKSQVPVFEVARHFSSSANTYHCGAQLQQTVGQHCYDLIRDLHYGATLDLGCGPGLFSKQLEQLSKQMVNLDLSDSMLKANKSAAPKVQADSHDMPFIAESFDLVFSSLMIQWCQLDDVLAEVYRVLKPGGRAVISTLVAGTLTELQRAWRSVDDDEHIHQYLSFSEVSDNVGLNPWRYKQLSQQLVTLSFNDVKGLAKELKQLGANYVQSRKNKGLMTKTRWQKMEQAYQSQFAHDGQIPASYQVVYLLLEK